MNCLEHSFRMIKRHYTVLCAMDQKDRAANGRGKVHVREPVPRQRATRLKNYSVDG